MKLLIKYYLESELGFSFVFVKTHVSKDDYINTSYTKKTVRGREREQRRIPHSKLVSFSERVGFPKNPEIEKYLKLCQHL